MAKPYIIQARLAEILFVAQNMRERDFMEITATSFEADRSTLAENMAMRLSGQPMAFVLGDMEIDGGRPIVCIAWIEIHPGVWQVGMFATDNMKKIGGFLTKQVCKNIIPALDASGVTKVFANSISGYDEIHDWLRFLGMTNEMPMPGHGKNGEDFVCFSWLRPKNAETISWIKPGTVA
ncbi:MAG: hypothetical protein JKY94_00935 [Rhodobacteraceae bacterium]|nr:hypothetical protein [Paracoccaceae bacterium]